MKLDQFVELIDFYSKTKLEKVKLIAYYYHMYNSSYKFSIDEMSEIFTNLGLHAPNKTRIRNKILQSRSFVKRDSNKFCLHAKEISNFKKKLNDIDFESEEVESVDTILPQSLYQNMRSYIVKLAKQINSSYENNIFDGCAVLMRRLLEVLLIHTYENKNVTGQIKNNSGEYKFLSKIINNAKTNSTLQLSRNTKNCLDDFRNLGNFSAHKIYYTAKRRDIDRVILDYRAAIEELLYKSDFKN